jgi:acyl-ACP thioesterase
MAAGDKVALEFVPVPPEGRVFRAERRVRLGDVTPRGRLRLDGMVRYLQDVSHDDTREADYVDKDGWVVRRTALRVTKFPVFQEKLHLSTWCSGVGSHWAERATRLEGERGGLIEAAAVWVHVDLESMKPAILADDFVASVGSASLGRRVSARSVLRNKPDPESARHLWPLRFSDMDALGHMNNAAYWEAVEEWLAAHRDVRAPFDVVIEHLEPVTPGNQVMTVVEESTTHVMIWHEVEGRLMAVTQLQR